MGDLGWRRPLYFRPSNSDPLPPSILHLTLTINWRRDSHSLSCYEKNEDEKRHLDSVYSPSYS